MPHHEMLSAFFVHGTLPDQQKDGWRLKGHAEDAFYRWLASWGMAVRDAVRPRLRGRRVQVCPPLTIRPEFVAADYVPDGQLFFGGLKGVTDRAAVRRATADARVERAAELVNANDEQWIVWHGLNDEGNALITADPRRGAGRGFAVARGEGRSCSKRSRTASTACSSPSRPSPGSA